MIESRSFRPFVLFIFSLFALLFVAQASVAVGVVFSAEDSGQVQAPPGTNLDDGQWLEMGSGSASGGGISSNDGDSYSPSLAIGPDGLPIIAWSDYSSGNREIYVRRWNGISWVEMGSGSASGGGISSSGGESWSPSLAISSGGRPIVTWSDDTSGNFEIYVRRWDGASWVEMGSSSASGGGISSNGGESESPSLAIGPDGIPIIAWAENIIPGFDGNGEIYVRRWDGASWVEMGDGSATGGGISSSVGRSYTPSLAIGPHGRPIIAWTYVEDSETAPGTMVIFVRRWDGFSWVEMGVGSASGGGISSNGRDSRSPSLAISSDGSPIIAWDNGILSWPPSYSVYVRRWDGTSWVDVGDEIGGTGKSSHSPSLAIRPVGVPIIAWEESDYESGHGDIYVRLWDGFSWIEMGSGSASGGGISSSGGWSWNPSLAINPAGIPIIAWSDDTSGDFEIYVRRWRSFAPPVADFSASPTSGLPPLTVEFTNLSTGNFDECIWDFGNDRVKTLCDNPSTKYRSEGYYTVTLTVKGQGGEDTKTIEDYIWVGDYRIFLPGVLMSK